MEQCLGWGLATATSKPDFPPAHLSNESYPSPVTLSPESQTLEIWKFKSRYIEQCIRVKKVKSYFQLLSKVANTEVKHKCIGVREILLLNFQRIGVSEFTWCC